MELCYSSVIDFEFWDLMYITRFIKTKCGKELLTKKTMSVPYCMVLCSFWHFLLFIAMWITLSIQQLLRVFKVRQRPNDCVDPEMFVTDPKITPSPKYRKASLWSFRLDYFRNVRFVSLAFFVSSDLSTFSLKASKPRIYCSC